jgi:peptide/nickel transport system permease protein
VPDARAAAAARRPSVTAATARRLRPGLFLVLVAAVVIAPVLAPYDPGRQFDGYPYAPPMAPHVIDASGAWHAPFAYPIRLVDPIERRYVDDRTRGVTFRSADPWFLLGSDALGRDVLSRVLAGTRLSLGVALLSTFIALLIGAIAGATAGYGGGWTDTALMRVADVVIVLPAIYLVLALRGALPIFLSPWQVFTALVSVLALIGWPTAARGVRGILIVEREAEYAEAARALGAGPWRVIARHLLPATRGFLAVQATVLVPAFIAAEATLSFVGLGFAQRTASWGVMLHDAANVGTAADAPWLLAPAAAIVLAVLVVHAAGASRDPLLWDRERS